MTSGADAFYNYDRVLNQAGQVHIGTQHVYSHHPRSKETGEEKENEVYKSTVFDRSEGGVY